MAVDYYELLEVARDADGNILKKAYRQLALRFHPDRNPGDAEAEARFKQISEAYEVLSDPQRRQVYDRYGHEGLKNGGFSGFSNAQDIFSQFGDLFSDLFGGRGGGARGRPRGDHLRIDIQVTLEECFAGTSRRLEVPRQHICDRCTGNGAEPGTKATTCPTCNGSGQVVMGRGYITMSTTCPRCRGQRQIIPTPCTQCRGAGQVQKVDAVQVRVPPGIDEGMKLRLEGKGGTAPPGGEPGDLFVVVHLAEHDRFERHQADLLAEVELDIVQACLGDRITLPGIDEPVEIAVSGGTQPGDILRVPGKGMPHLEVKRGRGDLLLRVGVRIPTALTEAQRAALEAYRVASGSEPEAPQPEASQPEASQPDAADAADDAPDAPG